MSSHTVAQVVRAHEGPCRLSSVEWSDTRRRIGGSFTRTSQAFARFNPEIRTGAAELVEHRADQPNVYVSYQKLDACAYGLKGWWWVEVD